MSLVGKVALVTGATRGIGKGIALQLGENGAKVYVTGRTLKAKSATDIGSLEMTCNEIEKRGGQAVPVQVDHENDAQIKQLFEQISSEQDGQLDILVNNAYKGVTTIFDNIRKKFWQQEPTLWDEINTVGLRNHWLCTTYASRMMVPRKQGLIVNITSLGGQNYLFNAAYGIGKAALDRMSVDCGLELKKHNVACMSLMLGAVRTELTSAAFLGDAGAKMSVKGDPSTKLKMSAKQMFEEGETVEFGGKLITALAKDPKLMKRTARVVIGADYAADKGIKDTDGREIMSHRSVAMLGPMVLPKSMQGLTKYPGLKIPQPILDIGNSKYFQKKY